MAPKGSAKNPMNLIVLGPQQDRAELLVALMVAGIIPFPKKPEEKPAPRKLKVRLHKPTP